MHPVRICERHLGHETWEDDQVWIYPFGWNRVGKCLTGRQVANHDLKWKVVRMLWFVDRTTDWMSDVGHAIDDGRPAGISHLDDCLIPIVRSVRHEVTHKPDCDRLCLGTTSANVFFATTSRFLLSVNPLPIDNP